MKKYSLLLVSCFIFLTSCNLLPKADDPIKTENSPDREQFLKGQSLALTGEYEKAIPILMATLLKKNSDEEQALLLLARCHDQMSQPEKAILVLTDLLTRRLDPVTELKSRTLLVKNQTKVNLNIQKTEDFKTLRSLINMANEDKVLVLENLRWAMDFSCDQYCLAEVSFLQQMQVEYLYIVETDERASERAAGILEDKYNFFVGFLDKEFLDVEFKKKLMWALIDALDKFKSLQPHAVTVAMENHPETISPPVEGEPATAPAVDADSELATQIKIFSNLNELKRKLVIRYDSIKSAK